MSISADEETSLAHKSNNILTGWKTQWDICLVAALIFWYSDSGMALRGVTEWEESTSVSEQENVLVLAFVNAVSLMGCIVVVTQVKISSNVEPYIIKKGRWYIQVWHFSIKVYIFQ